MPLQTKQQEVETPTAPRKGAGDKVWTGLRLLPVVLSLLSKLTEAKTATFNPIVGNPDRDAAAMDGAQAFPDTCAIKAQEAILQQFFVHDFDEASLRQFAFDKGWYVPGQGTPIEHVGKLLEEAGIPITRKVNATGIDLFNALSHGKKVIVGVDCGELSSRGSMAELIEETLLGHQADHAVLVSGLDYRDPTCIGVLITDPASGTSTSVPMADFLHAWEDSRCFLVETNIPAPQWCLGMQGFDYGLGSIPEIDGVPFGSLAGAWDNFLSPEIYSSAFDLTELISVIPLSYAEQLAQAAVTFDLSLPANWATICLPDDTWLSNAIELAGLSEEVVVSSDSFLNIASWLSELFT